MHYGERKDRINMWEEQAGAWRTVCDTLNEHDPTCFSSATLSGIGCAVLEITRLYAKKRELQRVRQLIASHQHGYCDTPNKLCELCGNYESNYIHNVGPTS